MFRSALAPLPLLDRISAPERLLVVVLLWHLVFWVLAPLLAYDMLPLDTLELLGWGQEWQWGYYKHPPLGAWLGEAALRLAGGRPGVLYLLAQLALVVTLLYVWRSARLLLDAPRAALAAVLLEGSYFHTVLTPNFNMNTLQLPVWAALVFHFLKAMRGAPRHWLWFGLFAALALLTKYSGVLLLASCAACVVASARGRQALRQPQLWLGAALALALLAPHLLWLVHNDWLPLAYLRSFDAPGTGGAAGHLLEPLRFAAGALLSLAPAVLLWLTLRDRGAARPPWRADTALVLALCLGPLLLAMFYGVLTGSRLKSTWAFAFFNPAGIALLLLLPTRVDAARLRRFGACLAALMLLTAGAHLAYKTGSDRSKTAFDGAALAHAVAAHWGAHHDTPLRIVAGDHVLTAIVSSYAPSRPSMLVEGDFRLSPWLAPADLRRHGAALVCAAPGPCVEHLAALGGDAHWIEVDGRRFRSILVAPVGGHAAP